MEQVDATALRLTARLVHCMQKERGATCVVAVMKKMKKSTLSDTTLDPPQNLVGTGGHVDLSEMESVTTQKETNATSMTRKLEQYRKNTDNAFLSFNARIKNRSSFQAALMRIRAMQDKRDMYQPLNSLIAHILRDQIETLLASLEQSKSKTKMKRTLSFGALSQGSGTNSDEPPLSRSGSKLVNQSASWTPMTQKSNPANLILTGIIANNKGIEVNKLSSACLQSSSASLKEMSGIGKALENHEMNVNDSPQFDLIEVTNTVASLVSLLSTFAKLKESKGIERSSLPGILKMSAASEESKSENDEEVRLLISYLVMEMEKQRSLVRDVRKKAMEVEEAYGGAMHTSFPILTEESLELSPELSNIQDLIRLDFDMKAFRQAISFDDFWNLITAYMDKLHSLELLIIEEIETKTDDFLNSRGDAPLIAASMSSQTDPNEPIQMLLSSLNSSSARKVTSKTDALSLVRSIPSDNVKACLMTLLDSIYVNIWNSNDDGKKEETKMENLRLIESASEITPKKEWEVNLYEVKFTKRIGRGGAGTTYLGKWRGQDVAIKVAAMTELGIEGWNAEVQSLQKLHHTNIIRLLGSICNPPPQPTRCLILEYCDAGDLELALKQPVPPNFFFHISKSIANGLSYLHDRGILHRDIKPENVLLHGDVVLGKFVVKLTDFGLSTSLRSDNNKEHSAETGTYRWMAPEVIRHEAYSHQADVYSFSLVVWQLITHEEPFAKNSQLEAAQLVAMHESRPLFPEGTPKEIEEIISRGWSADPSVRPSFDDLCTELQSLGENMAETDQKWLSAAYGHPIYNPDAIGRSERISRVQNNQGKDRTEGRRPSLTNLKNSRKKFQVKMGLFGKKY